LIHYVVSQRNCGAMFFSKWVTLDRHFTWILSGRLCQPLPVATMGLIFTARSSYDSAVLGIVILFVWPSVCLSVKRVLCDEIKEHTAEVLILHERVIALVSWYRKRLVGNVTFHLKLAIKLTHPLEKRRNVSTVRTSEKCSIVANRKSTTRFPMRYRWSAYVTPNSREWWLRKRICRFLWIKFKFNRLKSATKFLYVKTSRSKVVVEPFFYLTVLAVNITLKPNI